MRYKRVSYKKEPKLHVHRYIVALSYNTKEAWETKYYYCRNLKEAKAMRNKLVYGGVMEIYKADHNFIGAWER